MERKFSNELSENLEIVKKNFYCASSLFSLHEDIVGRNVFAIFTSKVVLFLLDQLFVYLDLFSYYTNRFHLIVFGYLPVVQIRQPCERAGPF